MKADFIAPLLVITFGGDAVTGWTDGHVPEFADELTWLVLGLLGLGMYVNERRTLRRRHILLSSVGVAAGGLVGLLGKLISDPGGSLPFSLLALGVMLAFMAAAAY